jgi:hypothetical protein
MFYLSQKTLIDASFSEAVLLHLEIISECDGCLSSPLEFPDIFKNEKCVLILGVRLLEVSRGNLDWRPSLQI